MFLVITRIGIFVCKYLISSYYDNVWVSAPQIADKYGINVRSVNSALARMKRAGLLLSRVGGREPGFIFAKDPKEISTFDVIKAMQGDFTISCCKNIISGLKCECGDRDSCNFFNLFEDMAIVIRQKLSEFSIFEYVVEINE